MAQLFDLFRALGDPTRLRIIGLIRAMELSVGELAQVLDQSQPRVSRHVKILCEVGLATRRREGSWVFLHPAPTPLAVPLFSLLDAAEGADGEDVGAADRARLDAVRTERVAAAARYFADHADEWDAIRKLHIADTAVERALADVVGPRIGRLVDVGTGTGRMLELFADGADHAIGIDRSPEMLRVARGKLAALGADAIELRQAEITALPLSDEAADTVIVHQVLHYLPAADEAIRELARIAAPGGRVVIVDFDQHDREELRTQDAHARLGFSDGQIGAWFAAAGLMLGRIETLGGGPLTVKIWVGERRGQPQAVAA